MDIANKTLSELRTLAAKLGVTPSGNPRWRKTWISAIESATCDRLADSEHSPGVDRHSGYFTDDRPPNGGDGRGRIEAIETSDTPWQPNSEECNMIAEMFLFAAGIGPEIEASDNSIDASPPESGITLSPRFLSIYLPPSTEKQFVSDESGQLSLLNFTEEEEPPDPDDFEGNMFAFWAAYDAWCDRNPDDSSEQCTGAELQRQEPIESQRQEPIELSLASMCEWAPCPEEWYEPVETNETSSSTLEISPVSLEQSEVMELPAPSFFIPTFNDRNSEDPPTAGSFARLPTSPKGFPPANSVAKFARVKVSSGRSPPGGDAKLM